MEEHNREIQQSFAQRMDGSFRDVQHCIQQHGDKQRHMLSSYSQAVGKSAEVSPSQRRGWAGTVYCTCFKFTRLMVTRFCVGTRNHETLWCLYFLKSSWCIF